MQVQEKGEEHGTVKQRGEGEVKERNKGMDVGSYECVGVQERMITGRGVKKKERKESRGNEKKRKGREMSK